MSLARIATLSFVAAHHGFELVGPCAAHERRAAIRLPRTPRLTRFATSRMPCRVVVNVRRSRRSTDADSRASEAPALSPDTIFGMATDYRNHGPRRVALKWSGQQLLTTLAGQSVTTGCNGQSQARSFRYLEHGARHFGSAQRLRQPRSMFGSKTIASALGRRGRDDGRGSRGHPLQARLSAAPFCALRPTGRDNGPWRIHETQEDLAMTTIPSPRLPKSAAEEARAAPGISPLDAVRGARETGSEP